MSDYPSSLRVAPLTTWPGTPTRVRERSQFSATLRSTLEVLDRELAQIGARTPVLEVAIPAGQFRLDGRPRATAKAEHPGVVLSLPRTRVGPLRYAADRFLTWQDNLRAIALGMQALRKVDRYGITSRGEQYAGFKALPAAAEPSDLTTVEGALMVIASASGWPSARVAADPEGAFRVAAKASHPDRGGSAEGFDRLRAAVAVVRGEASR